MLMAQTLNSQGKIVLNFIKNIWFYCSVLSLLTYLVFLIEFLTQAS